MIFLILFMIIIGILIFLIQRLYYKDYIQSYKNVLKRGKEYIKLRSEYFTSSNIETKGKLKILMNLKDINENNPLVLKLINEYGYEELKIFKENSLFYSSGCNIMKIEVLSNHKFRFASDFEAGMEFQESTIYSEDNKGNKIPLEIAGWESNWILIFD